MPRGLTARRENILKIIVSEYVATAIPVASQTIFRNYDLGVSPATIRNDMAVLEEEGYIAKPHTSAGSIPQAKGYRYYVESLTKSMELPLAEQHHIRDSFLKVEDELNRWLKLAAAIMARLMRNAALVTFPKAKQCRLKHLELISSHEFLSMLVLVLSEAILKQHLLSFDQPVTQEELTQIASKLNAGYAGQTRSEISAKKLELSTSEQRVTNAVIEMMTAEDEMEYNEPHLEGLRLMLGQPEFVEKERMLRIMELMEAKDWLKSVLLRQWREERIHVVIGEENEDESLRDLSLVFSPYGIPDRAGGTIGVIGPTRMDYGRAISTVNYMSEVLSDLIAGVCH